MLFDFPLDLGKLLPKIVDCLSRGRWSCFKFRDCFFSSRNCVVYPRLKDLDCLSGVFVFRAKFFETVKYNFVAF